MSPTKRKVYIVGGTDLHYANWTESKIVDKMDKADYVILTGGSDLSPSLYGKTRHFTTHNNPTRDRFEEVMYYRARDLDKPILGVCRGCQFVTAMAGGILVQDQQNLRAHHSIDTFDGHKIIVSSSHHQAAYPWGLPADDYKIIGWSKGLSAFHYGETDKDEMVNGKVEGEKEVEMVYYPKIRALGLQSHPETVFWHMKEYQQARDSIAYCRGLLDRFLAGAL